MTTETPTRRDPDAIRSIVSRSKIDELGRVAAGEYVRIRDREYLLGARFSSPSDVRRGRDDLLVSDPRPDPQGGPDIEGYRLAKPVPTGTYAAIAARSAAKAARVAAAQRPRAFDELEAIPALQRRPAGGVLIPSLVTGRADGIDATPRGVIIDERPARTTLSGALESLAELGAVLRVLPSGKLIVNGPSARLGLIVAIVRPIERLIVGRLTGSPVQCEAQAHQRPATTVLAIDVAACAECAEGAV